jgi:hypothetical protein
VNDDPRHGTGMIRSLSLAELRETERMIILEEQVRQHIPRPAPPQGGVYAPRPGASPSHPIEERRSTYTVATVGVEWVESSTLAAFNPPVENRESKSTVGLNEVERPCQMPNSTFSLNLRSTQRVENTGVSPLPQGVKA